LPRTDQADADVVTDDRLTSIPPEEFDDFAALCTSAATIAAGRGLPVVVSWTVVVPRLRVADGGWHLSPTKGRRTFVGECSRTGQRRLAVGTVLDLTGRGPGRFEHVSQAWRRIRDGALIGGTGRGPVIVGGTSPDTVMWLPAAELTKAPGFAPEVTLNALIGSAAAVGGAFRQAQSAVRALLRDSVFVEQQRPQLISQCPVISA
jgi:hypothetical protein